MIQRLDLGNHLTDGEQNRRRILPSQYGRSIGDSCWKQAVDRTTASLSNEATDVTFSLRATQKKPFVAVVFLTAHSFPAAARKWDRLDVIRYTTRSMTIITCLRASAVVI